MMYPTHDDLDAFASRSLAVAPEHTTKVVEGREIHVRAWGDPRDETVILIHGIAAHGGWWESAAPFLTAPSANTTPHPAPRRVLAVDLAGHGDSDRRAVYSTATWASDIAALIRSENAPLVIGHSLGGMVALRIARDHGASIRGVIVVDAPLRTLSEQRRGIMRRRALTAGTVMESEAVAIARFRPMPDEGGLDPMLVARVAGQSLATAGDGVRWKVDPNVFLAEPLALEELTPPGCPVALIRGEFGMLTEEAAIRALALMPGNLGHSAIAGAGHHPMLSHPQQLAQELRRLVDGWPERGRTTSLRRATSAPMTNPREGAP